MSKEKKSKQKKLKRPQPIQCNDWAFGVEGEDTIVELGIKHPALDAPLAYIVLGPDQLKKFASQLATVVLGSEFLKEMLAAKNEESKGKSEAETIH